MPTNFEVIKTNKKEGYCVLSNKCAFDKKLSVEARFIMLIICSLPSDWRLSVKGLASLTDISAERIRKILSELELNGYMKKFDRERTNSGRFGMTRYVFRESKEVGNNIFAPPHQENPDVENPDKVDTDEVTAYDTSGKSTSGTPYQAPPHQENPDVENPTLHNTYIDSNYLNNNNNTLNNNTLNNNTIRNNTLIHTRAREENPGGDGFEILWATYPKKVSKGAALLAFEKINPDNALLNKMLDTINVFKQTQNWQNEGGRYIPKLENWLKDKGWEDEPLPSAYGRELTEAEKKLKQMHEWLTED